MEATGFSILTAIIFIPIVAGVVILFLDRKNRDLVRGVGVTASAAVLALSLAVFFGYDNYVKADGGLIDRQNALMAGGVERSGAAMFADALAFEQRIVWVESLGIAYHVGVDGVSAPMVLLTGMVAVAGVLISWNIEDRLREFMAFFMFLVAGVYGVFIAVDLFMLFFFYELAIFPMYLLIAGWGWVKLREYAAMKLTLYILVGSVFALVGAVAMYFAAGAFFAGGGKDVFDAAIASGLLPADSGPYSWSIVQLTLAAENGAFGINILGIEGLNFAKFWFPFMFMGFGVLAGVFPFHNWSPDGHVAAPTAVSMIHAGVLMKVGAFAALRSGVQLLPEGADIHLPWMVFLTLINVVYG
ncbi:MAG: proton-conducting transporter membrane subunit, partial [Chloroflexi bacterium]|nr:proton-conducting transporter membrane subunit [Chloroflexota bacterium]